jgi:outer membrane immunogenic protein
VPAGRELLQKSHNFQQTDRLAQFKLVWVRGGRFCYAITGYQFLIEGVMEMTSKLAALLAGALSLGLVTAASAADMAVKARPVAPLPVFSWTGFYIGGAIGGRWTDNSWNTSCQETGFAATCVVFADRFATNNSQKFNSSAFRGSIYGGYNWQVATWVVGLEGDFGWADNKKTNAGIPGLESPTVVGAPGLDTSTVKQTWDGSFRGRIGFLVTPSVLFYGTGGVAFAHVEASSHCGTAFPVGWCTAVNVGRTDTTSSDRVGWTVGGGIEAMLAPNWLLRGEYRYADYGNLNFVQLQGPVINVDAFTASVKYRTHTALVGLAYKF